MYSSSWIGLRTHRSFDVARANVGYPQGLPISTFRCEQADWAKSIFWSVSELTCAIKDTARMFLILHLSLLFLSLHPKPIYINALFVCYLYFGNDIINWEAQVTNSRRVIVQKSYNFLPKLVNEFAAWLLHDKQEISRWKDHLL